MPVDEAFKRWERGASRQRGVSGSSKLHQGLPELFVR